MYLGNIIVLQQLDIPNFSNRHYDSLRVSTPPIASNPPLIPSPIRRDTFAALSPSDFIVHNPEQNLLSSLRREMPKYETAITGANEAKQSSLFRFRVICRRQSFSHEEYAYIKYALNEVRS